MERRRIEPDWKTETEYSVGDRVVVWDEVYECTVAHKSNIFADAFFGKDNARVTIPVSWKRYK
jgi:hypothetical protein